MCFALQWSIFITTFLSFTSILFLCFTPSFLEGLPTWMLTSWSFRLIDLPGLPAVIKLWFTKFTLCWWYFKTNCHSTVHQSWVSQLKVTALIVTIGERTNNCIVLTLYWLFIYIQRRYKQQSLMYFRYVITLKTCSWYSQTYFALVWKIYVTRGNPLHSSRANFSLDDFWKNAVCWHRLCQEVSISSNSICYIAITLNH